MEYVVAAIALIALAAFLAWKVSRPRATGKPEHPPTPEVTGDDLTEYFDQQGRKRDGRD